jgi:TP901 family phage tail tape measure protein
MSESLGTVGTVWAQLALDSSQYESGMARAQTTMLGMSSSILSTVGRLAGFGIGLYAIKRGIDAVISSFVDFDRQMHNIWTLTNNTKEQMSSLAGELRSTAIQYNVTASQAAKALYQIYSATFYGADATNILTTSMKAAAAGLSDVFTAADMTTTVLNAYRMSADKATYVNDLLFQVVRYGKATYSELADQFGRLAGIAAPAGVSISDMTAAIATLTRQGIASDWAVTSLRQTIMQILRPGAALKDIITGLGYESGRALFAENGFAGSLAMINTAAENSGQFLENLFSNVRAVTAVMPLASTAAGEYAKDLARAAAAIGTMTTAFKEASQAWGYQFEKIKASMQNSAISIGKTIVPAFGSILQMLDLLLKPLALVSEGLVALGGQYALAAVAGVGTIALAVWGLSFAVTALNANLLASKTLMFSVLGVGGGIQGAIAKILVQAPGGIVGGLGLGALGMLGAGVTIKGGVTLDLALSTNVTGAEKVRAEIEGSLETALGPIIGGAAIGTMFAPGIGTAIGAGVGLGIAAAQTLVIWIKHMVVESAGKQQGLEDIALKTAQAMTLPATIPQENIVPGIHDLATKIVALSKDLQEAGGAGRVAALTTAQGLYDRKTTGEFGTVSLVLKEEFAQIQAAAQELGIELSKDDLDRFIAKWRETLKKDIPVGLSGISDYIKSQLPKTLKAALDTLDTSLTGKLDAAGFAAFMSSLTTQIQEFVSAITSSVSAGDIETSVSLWKEYFDSLSGMQSQEELDRARGKIQKWFSLITKGFSDEEMAGLVIRLHQAGMSFDDLNEIMGMLGVESESLKAALLKLWEETKGTADAIPTTSAQIQAARKEFMGWAAEVKAGDVTLEDSATMFGKMKDAASKWADYAEMAKKYGWDSAESIQFLADEMDGLVGNAEDAASAIDRFTKALNSVALAAGASTQIQGIFADMQKLLVGASTLGEAASIISAIQSGTGTGEGLMQNLEGIFGPGSTYSKESQEWARKTWSEVATEFPKMGLTIAQMTEAAKSLAEEQKKQAEESAKAAVEAAKEAYAAEQEAFKNQFIRPTLDAVATGDFAGAADKINALRDNFAGLVNQGAQLGMSATDILGMMQSARSELLSSIDGYIAISNATPELVEALKSAKKQIEEMWSEAKTSMQKALDEINLSALVEDPAKAAMALRGLAREFDDAKGVSKYTDDLTSQLQEEIAARGKLGYDTGLLDDALLRFNSALMGTMAPFERFMGAINKFSDGIVELADAIIPGFGSVLGKAFALANAIATTGGLSWAKGKPVTMAEGGVATQPTFAVIGEKGPEAVIPLSDLTNLSGFSSPFGGTSSAFTMPTMSNQPTIDVGQTFGGLDTGAIESLSSQIIALGNQIIAAAMGLVSAIESSTLMLSSTFASVPAISALPGAPEPGAFESNVQVSKGFAAVPSTALPGAPEGFGQTLDLESRFTSDMISAIGRLEQTVAQISALPAMQPQGGALTPIPEIPTFNATPAAVEPFKPDVIAQALAKALTAADITPGKMGEEKKFSSPFLDLIAKWGPTINSAISFVLSAFKFISDAATSAIADFETAAKEAANALGDILVKAADHLVSSMTSLASNMEGLITSTETYSRLQSAVSSLQSKIFNTLMGWAWPLIAIFEKLTGAVEETANSLNVPTGYKVTRNEWAAARPGEPGVKTGGAGELPEWMNNVLLKFKDAIQGIVDTFKSFSDIMSGIWEALAPIVMEGIIPALQSFVDGLLSIGEKIRDELLPVLKETLAATLTGFLKFFSGEILGVMTFFTDTLIAIMPNLALFAESMGALGATLPGLAVALSEALSPAINTLLEGLTLLTGWITTTMIPGLQAALTEFGALWTSNIGPFFTETIFPQILAWATAVYNFVMNEVVPFFTGTLLPFMENEIWPTFTGIIEDLITTFTNLWDDMEKYWPQVKQFILDQLADWGDKLIGGLETLEALELQKVGDTLGALKVLWESGSLDIWDKIKLSFGVVFLDIVAAVGRLWDAMAPVLEPLLSILGGQLLLALEVITAAFDVLAFAVHMVLQPFIGLANVIIAIHNLFAWLLGGNQWDYIPGFAKGGIVTQPTFAMIGEAGPEAVIPLSGGPVIPELSGKAAGTSGGAMAGGNIASSDGTILVQTKVVNQMNGRTISAELYNTRKHLSKLGSSNGRAWNPA